MCDARCAPVESSRFSPTLVCSWCGRRRRGRRRRRRRRRRTAAKGDCRVTRSPLAVVHRLALTVRSFVQVRNCSSVYPLLILPVRRRVSLPVVSRRRWPTQSIRCLGSSSELAASLPPPPPPPPTPTPTPTPPPQVQPSRLAEPTTAGGCVGAGGGALRPAPARNRD